MIKVLTGLKKIYLVNKRQKIITVCIILSLGLLYTQLVPFYSIQKFILLLSITAYFLTLWALWEGINPTKAVVLLILPTLFTLAVASYYFLLPVRWLTRLPVAIGFGLSYYALLLSANVFNVAAIRTIPLYRASSTVNFLFTLITAFLLFNVIFSFKMQFYWNTVAVALLAIPLVVQVIWSLEMEDVNSRVFATSVLLSLVLGEVALGLSFWPLSGGMASLILTTYFYTILGIVTHNFRDRLSRGVVWEYIGVAGLVLILALVSTSWTG